MFLGLHLSAYRDKEFTFCSLGDCHFVTGLQDLEPLGRPERVRPGQRSPKQSQVMDKMG